MPSFKRGDNASIQSLSHKKHSNVVKHFNSLHLFKVTTCEKCTVFRSILELMSSMLNSCKPDI